MVSTERMQTPTVVATSGIRGELDHVMTRPVKSALATLAKWLPQRNDDSDWWFNTTASQLVLMLSNADYSVSQQYEMLLFYYHFISPHLGPRPKHTRAEWNSFMTDDFSPIEYSWKWGKGNSSPEVRFSIEAINSFTGTAIDPLNQLPTLELLQKLGLAMPELDLGWFAHFRASLFGLATPALEYRDSNTKGRSSMFLAFEMARGAVAVKAYFIPVKRHGLSVTDQIWASIKAAGCTNLDAIHAVEAFLADEGSSLQPFMIGIDCVAPSKSRLKIYCRTARTDFNFVRRVMTLGGQIKGTEHLEPQLCDLWQTTLQLGDDFAPEKELGALQHDTAGILYYFDASSKSPLPDVKTYIPVRHYAKSDQETAQGLSRFLERQGRGGYGQAYVQTVNRLSPGHDVVKGTHTYVSCGYQNGELAITSYFSPQLYHPLRYAERQSQSESANY